MKRIPTRSAQSFGLESLESRALMAAADLVSGGLTMLNPFHDCVHRCASSLRV